MTEERFEAELRDRHGRLRAEDQARAPDFARMLEVARTAAAAEPSDPSRVVPIAGARRRSVTWASHKRRWAGLVGVLAAAALAGVLLQPPSADEDFEALVAGFSSDMAGGGWTSPTAGLLEVPGIEMIRSVPAIGRSLELGIDPGSTSGQGNNG